MSTVEERWREGLVAEAVEIPVAGDVRADRVMRLGRRRRHRNQAVGALACVALVAGSTAAWNANRAGRGDRPTDLRIADETGDESPATTVVGPFDGRAIDPSTLPPVTLVPSPYGWTATPVPFGEAVNALYGWSPGATTSGLVAVSTRPGVRRGADAEGVAIYQSADGVTWSTVADPGTDRWFGGVARTASGLVAVGTAAATAPIERDDAGNGVGDVVVSFTGADGDGWKDVVLPVDLRGVRRLAEAAGLPLSLGVSGAKVVVAGDVTTVAVSVTGMPRMLPDLLAAKGVSIDAVGAVSGRGVQVNGRWIPWADLGVPAEVAAVMGTRTTVYRAVDGAGFTVVGAPIDEVSVQDMAAAGDTIGLIGHGVGLGSVDNPAGVVVAFVAADGTVTTVGAPPLDPGTFAAGSLGGRFAVAGQRGGWPTLAVWTGSAWDARVLANGVVRDGTSLGVQQAAVGEGGVGFVLMEQDDPSAGIEVTDRGYALRSLGQRGVALFDAGGTELTRWPSVYDLADVPGVRVVFGEPSSAYPEPTTTAVGRPRLIVNAGDTATAIAQRLGVSLDELRRANPDVDLDRLEAGQSLEAPISFATPTTMPGGEPSVPVALEVLDATGVIARLDVASLASRLQDAWNLTTPPATRSLLLHSADGVSWSLSDLGELAGTGVTMAASVVSTTSGLVVTVATDENDPDAPEPTDDMPGSFKQRVALVGTRR